MKRITLAILFLSFCFLTKAQQENPGTLSPGSPASGPGPMILSHPHSQNACPGSTITFTVSAFYANQFCWQRSTDGGNTWTYVTPWEVTSSGSSTYTVSNIADSMNDYKYRAIVRGNGQVISQYANLFLVSLPVTITAQPVNRAVCENTNVYFYIKATGSALNFQWQIKSPGETSFSDVAGYSTDSTLPVISPAFSQNNSQFRCFVNSCNGSKYSDTVTLTVFPLPQIGPDSFTTTSCQGCYFDLTTLYNTSGLTAVWGPAVTNPAAVLPGRYRLYVTSNAGCKDDANITVNWMEDSILHITNSGDAKISTARPGNTFQWQVDYGTGFTNMANIAYSPAYYSGVNTPNLYIWKLPSTHTGEKFRCVIDGNIFSDTTTIRYASYWTGAMTYDNYWSTQYNWSGGAIPDGNTDVYVFSGLLMYPSIVSDTQCRSLFVAPGASVSLASNRKLIITGR